MIRRSTITTDVRFHLCSLPALMVLAVLATLGTSCPSGDRGTPEQVDTHEPGESTNHGTQPCGLSPITRRILEKTCQPAFLRAYVTENCGP